MARVSICSERERKKELQQEMTKSEGERAGMRDKGESYASYFDDFAHVGGTLTFTIFFAGAD